MERSTVLDSLKELADKSEIEITCLVKENGDVLSSVGKGDTLQLETFGIMSATIFGAANTANEQLQKKPPKRIVIRSSDGSTVIRGAGKNHLLVARTSKNAELDQVHEYMDDAAKTIVRSLQE